MYTNQKWQLRQHYQPSDRRTPRTNHIVALANVSIVDHLSSLESLIRMGLKTLSPASSGSPASKSSTSSSSTTSSTNQQMIEFIMDQQTERDIRELFRKLDMETMKLSGLKITFLNPPTKVLQSMIWQDLNDV